MDLSGQRQTEGDLRVVLSYIEHFKYLPPERLAKVVSFIEQLAQNAGSCPNCGFTSSDESESIIRVPHDEGVCPTGCAKFSQYDRTLGFRCCPVCGDEIEWQGNGKKSKAKAKKKREAKVYKAV